MSPLKIEHLNKSYRNTKAINNLSIEIKPGKLYGFVGINGAGKTTTINILANILKPDSGKIEMLGKEIKSGDWQYKSKVGFVLEEPKYIEHLTGAEFLKFAGIMQNLDETITKARSKELINFLELNDKQNDLIKTYSKGMKKKISFATALLHNPKLLILDEPLEGIDPVSSNMIKKLLKNFIKNGKTVLISSHELGTIEDICNEFIIIHQGSNIFQGTMGMLKEEIGVTNEELINSSLEELFVKLIGKDSNIKTLSWF
jgi:ABC-2 type transport system ATP-binding protein